eukprot:snap_masked-scaffold_5-processed-gene-7.32-mRNA-1 protein AED:0.27 eAED:0.27 QI:0/0/0/1/1/1/2/0/570
MSELYQKYDVLYEIAKGGFSRVYKASPLNNPSNFVAVKVVRTSLKSSSELFVSTENEIEIMNEIAENPIMSKFTDNFVQIVTVFREPRRLMIVMEYLDGGELFDRIIERESYSEIDAARVLKDMTKALQALHNVGIVHRDIKPENLCYKYKHTDKCLKIMDFGLSKYIAREEIMKTAIYVGTPGYLSPEILSIGEYSPKSDIFSLGMPFDGNNSEIITKNVLKGKYRPLEGDDWDHISNRAKKTIKGMLHVDPNKRYDHNRILWCSWLTETLVKKNLVLLNSTVENLKKLRKTDERKKVVDKFRVLLEENYGSVNRKLISIVEENNKIRKRKILLKDLSRIKQSFKEYLEDGEEMVDKELFVLVMNEHGLNDMNLSEFFDTLVEKQRDSADFDTLFKEIAQLKVDDILSALTNLASRDESEEEFLPLIFDLFTTKDKNGTKKLSFQGFKKVAAILKFDAERKGRDGEEVVEKMAKVYTQSKEFQEKGTTQANVSLSEVDMEDVSSVGSTSAAAQMVSYVADVFDEFKDRYKEAEGKTKKEKVFNMFRSSFVSVQTNTKRKKNEIGPDEEE